MAGREAPKKRHPSTQHPSTTDSGFILSLPKLPNPVTSDLAYKRLLSWYLPKHLLETIQPRLERFGHEAVSDEVNAWISNAERDQPYVKSRNIWGEKYPYDRLVTSEGWKQLGRWGISRGVVALGYEEDFGPYRRLAQHSFNYVYSASSAVFSCPVSMTSGAGRLLAHQLPNLPSNHPFHEVYRKIVAREGNWISSQWMTERPGGSDVHNSETFALYSPLSASEKIGEMRFDEGDWLVSGYKFFCSATDCDVCLMLAKTDSGELSLFIAPTKKTVRVPDGRCEILRNGIRFHRLKNKMGTKELPTAELELQNVRAWLVGPLDRGISTIATLLNVTRTHNAVTALSCWRRGMAIAKDFAKARTTLNEPLWQVPMHLRLLANMEVKFQGLLQLTFFTTSLLSFVDNGFPTDRPPGYPPLPTPGEQTTIVQRALTAMAKATACKIGCMALQECQEAMGGVGYLDEPDEPEFNISRLYRDTAANMTWEGTTNVLASEVVRHVLNGNNLELFSQWLEADVLANITLANLRVALNAHWSQLKHEIATNQREVGAALADGREILFSLAFVVSGALLAHDAQRDQDPIAVEVARRWILDGESGLGGYVLPHLMIASQRRKVDVKDRSNWDSRLVFGKDLPPNTALGYRAAAAKSSGRPEQMIAKL